MAARCGSKNNTMNNTLAGRRNRALASVLFSSP
jgi:hypothetical protein